MNVRRLAIHSTIALAVIVTPLGAAAGDTRGVSGGPMFGRNVSATPELKSSKAKIDGFQFYVPARNAAGAPVDVGYRDANSRVVETRDKARPLLSVYIDDDADQAKGDDVWAAYSLDDGDTWRRTMLSGAGGRSSFEVDGKPYPGVVSKPVLTLKGNRALAAWTSTYCESGFPGYEGLTADPHGVGGSQKSVDYAAQGFAEVGEVPYKCLWAARGVVDQATGGMTWYQPERLTSGVRYAMQIMANSAPGTGFVLAWGEDPDGLAPGSGSGPGEGWTGAHPNPGTDVWYSYLPWSGFEKKAGSPKAHPDDPAAISARPQPAETFSVPVPVSDNAPEVGTGAAKVGATRPAVAVSAYSVKKPDGSSSNGAWIAYGYEETKPAEGADESLDPESGKQVVHHAFDIKTPDVDSAGTIVSPGGESARRVRYISQPYGQMGESRTVGTLIYRMGVEGHAGSADFIMHRFVVPTTDAVAADNPFRVQNMTGPTNISATTTRAVAKDPVTGVLRATRWTQTAANLAHGTAVSSLESARGHRGMIKGDFLALGYLWTPNWDLFMQGRDVENYYVRRSFDGGRTFTTAPAAAPYNGDGVRSCRYFNDPATGKLLTPVCADIGPGQFEPAQNMTRLDSFGRSVIEPRLAGLPGTIPGSPYPEDVQDTSVLWQAWGTSLPKSPEGTEEDADPDVPVPDEGGGKQPLDIFYTFSQDYGDTYVEAAPVASGPSAQAEVQMRFSPDGSKTYAVWNDYGPGELDVMFRRFMPEAFPFNTVEGGLRPAAERFAVREGNRARVLIDRVGGRRGKVTVSYATVDGTAVAGKHYRRASGTLTFYHGDVGPKKIFVPTIENRREGPDVRFRVRLSTPTGGAWIERPSTAVTIRDDEDSKSPTSVAHAPRVTNRVAIPVTYQASDRKSAVRSVMLFVRKPGSTTFTREMVDRKIDGQFRYPTGGRNGTYRFFTVAVDAKGNREGVPRSADAVTRLDTTAPGMSSASVKPKQFDISRDGSVLAKVTVSERARVRFLIRNAEGVVRTLPVHKPAMGTVSARWYGRDDEGEQVRRGRYVAVMKATDTAGNDSVRRVAFRVRR